MRGAAGRAAAEPKSLALMDFELIDEMRSFASEQARREVDRRVVLIGADSRNALATARQAVRVEMQELDPIFTIDPNGAYQTADETVRAIEAMLPFNLSLVEQPTPRDRISMLADVRKRIPVPVMADEAVFTPGHLDEALALIAHHTARREAASIGLCGNAAEIVPELARRAAAGLAKRGFGKGDVRGVIASESSNNAKEGGNLIPTIAFGVPVTHPAPRAAPV